MFHENWNLCRYASATFFCNRLHSVFNLSVYNDGNKHGHTSLIVFGVEIQTIRNFEANIFACNNITIPFELVIIFWTVSVLSGTSYSIDRCIAIWYDYNVIP